jgi:type I restriction enzyme S subunit
LKHVEAGDFVISMRSFQGGLEYSTHTGSVSSAYVALTPIKWVEPRFFRHLFKSITYIQALQSTSDLVRDGQALRFENFSKVALPVLPQEEQIAIADHLDLETARIDKLIARKTRFIELLVEKRQALITQAVTKGLNPKVRMKDTSLEWLGKVPEHWSVVPIRIAAWYQEGPGIMAADFIEEGIPLLRVSCVQSQFASLEGCNYLDPEKVAKKWKHFRVDVGDLLISASATTGSISEVSNETVGAIPYTGIIRLKPSKLIEKEYLKSFLASQPFHEQINLFKVGSTIQHYGPTHLSQMKIILPPILEQKDISIFIRVRTARIDALVAKTERSIELLREHRTALISAAVTGKIDLRENA